MRMLFKQRFFSWFDSYDIYDEDGNVLFTVEGQLAWGHRLHILDAQGVHIATVKEHIFTFLPQFDLYLGEEQVGTLSKELALFSPRYNIDYNGWTVTGDFWEWEYTIRDSAGQPAAEISKQLMNWTDTYVIDVPNPDDALPALMVVLAIDAEKCSRSQHNG